MKRRRSAEGGCGQKGRSGARWQQTGTVMVSDRLRQREESSHRDERTLTLPEAGSRSGGAHFTSLPLQHELLSENNYINMNNAN